MAAITASATGNASATSTWPSTGRTGTITTSNASAAVTGSGTLFTSELNPGVLVQTGAGVTIGTVSTITDDTHLTLTGNAASTNAGIAYKSQGLPGTGDTVTIGAGKVVTADVAWSVGNDSTGFTTPGVYIHGAAAGLTIAAGITVQCRGDVTIDGTYNAAAALTLGAGAKFLLTPANNTAQCTLNISNYAHNQIVCNGTSGSRCAIGTDAVRYSTGGKADSNVTNGLCSQTAAHGTAGLVTAAYCDFYNMGNASNWGLISQADKRPGGTAPLQTDISITNCTFTRCSYVLIQTGGDAWDSNYTFNDNTFAGTVGNTSGGSASCANFGISSTASSGTRQVNRCVFDEYVVFGVCASLAFDLSVFKQGTTFGVGSAWASKVTFNRCLMYLDSTWPAGAVNLVADLTSCYVYGTTSSALYSVGGASWPSTTFNVTGCIFEGGWSTPGGAALALSPPSSGTLTLNCTGNIGLPNAAGSASAPLLRCSNDVTATRLAIVAEHNTWEVEGYWFAEIGHSQTTAESPSRWQSARANLFHGVTGNGGTTATGTFIASNVDGSAVADIMPPSATDYNARYKLNSKANVANFTNAANGYNSKWSVTPGAHDVSLDGSGGPQFVDGTRDFAAWGTTQGQGTAAATRDYVAGDPATRIPALLAYVRGGFAPQNSALQAASYPGDASTADANGTAWPGGAPGIGAVAYQAPVLAGNPYYALSALSGGFSTGG